MRPSRHCPANTPTSTVIANLVYVMDCLYERRRDYRQKIGFIANMDGWTMKHFSEDYCWQFMQVLQGHMAPGNVDLFLIVNPPVWFDTVWKIMKPMLVPSFRKKVHMIPEHKLKDFLEPGFEASLPNEFECGEASVKTLIQDFIAFRKYVEESCLDRAGAALDHTTPRWPTQRPQRHHRMRRRNSGASNSTSNDSAAASETSGRRRHFRLPRCSKSTKDELVARQIVVGINEDDADNDEDKESVWDYSKESVVSNDSSEWYTADLGEFDD